MKMNFGNVEIKKDIEIAELIQLAVATSDLPQLHPMPNPKEMWDVRSDEKRVPFAEPDEELKALIARTSPCYAIITYLPESGAFGGVVEHSFSMDIEAWRCNIFWTSDFTGDTLAWAKGNILNSIRDAYLIVKVTDPDCPIEIDWVTRKQAVTKFGQRNARFRIKEGRLDDLELMALRARSRFVYHTSSLRKLENACREVEKAMRAEIVNRSQWFQGALSGMEAQYVRLARKLVPHVAFPVDHYGKKIEPDYLMESGGIRVTWAAKLNGVEWSDVEIPWESIADEQRRRKAESKERWKLRAI